MGEVIRGRRVDPHHRHLPQRPDPRRRRATTPPAAPATSPPPVSSEQLAALGFRVGRLKTGTCPRLDARTIDFDRLEVQPGDDPPLPFSFSTARIAQPQIPCHITYTNARTHEIIRGGLDRSPLYTGRIQGRGPRYCPSIEDKVVRFADKERHQIFLEPEGRDTVEVYPNGLSTSLPLDVQVRDGALDPRPRAGRDHAAGLRDRVRLRRPDPAPAVAGDQAASAGSSTPGRSTARPATRRPRRRG